MKGVIFTLLLGLLGWDLAAAQSLESNPVAAGGNVVGSWSAQGIPLQIYTVPELSPLTSTLAFEGSVHGSLELTPEGAFHADYVVRVAVIGSLGLFPIDLDISDTTRAEGLYNAVDSLLILTFVDASSGSLLFTAEGDTLRLIESVSLGTYAALVEQLVPGAPPPLLVLRLVRGERGGQLSVAAADFDGDGKVGLNDFLSFAEHFRTRAGDFEFDPIFDLNIDDRIDFEDFLLFVPFFGKMVQASRLGEHKRGAWGAA